MVPTLLIGYDGTDEGQDALALARLLAPPLSAELVAACVKSVPHPHPHPRPRGGEWRERLEHEAPGLEVDLARLRPAR